MPAVYVINVFVRFYYFFLFDESILSCSEVVYKCRRSEWIVVFTHASHVTAPQSLRFSLSLYGD